MTKIRKQIIQNINKQKPFSYFLMATLFFFGYKGIVYARLGSFIPILLIIGLTVLMLFGLFYSTKTYRIFISFWSFLVISWSVIRILLAIVDNFIKSIPEAHVHDQIGIYGTILSLAFFVAGIYLWRNRKLA